MNNPQLKTPLFDAMLSVAESRKISFHTPGHKSGKGISTRFRKFAGPKIFSIDLTTLDEVDSLQKPVGVIRETLRLAARAFGADRSFFLLNGSSGGNHAMLLALLKPGQPVLVARNAHRSIIAGLILCGASPYFFDVPFEPGSAFPLNTSLAGLKQAIENCPQARCLILTSPNYFGIAADLPSLIAHAHDCGLTVLVDEAHGPHFHFHEDLPPSAMASGADLCVQSTHKIIGGMTQASMLHVSSRFAETDRLEEVLALLQTTSPSYILMASLDLARMQMATEGKELLGKAIRLAKKARSIINEIPGLSCFGPADLPEDSAETSWALDVTKLTVNVSALKWSGFEVSQILNQEHRIQVEMADPVHVLIIVSIGDREDDLQALTTALRKIAETGQRDGPLEAGFNVSGLPSDIKQPVLSPRDAFFATQERCILKDTVGRTAAQIVTVYPPGIPILIPGEMITVEIVSYLEQMRSLGATLDGMGLDHKMAVVQE